MLGAGAIYLGIFFLSHKLIDIQWAGFYNTDQPVSPYYSAEAPNTSNACSYSLSDRSKDLYPNGGYRTA